MRASACARVNQFPALLPDCLTPGTWSMAAATAASSSPLAAASRANFLMAARRWLTVDGRVAAAFEGGAVGLHGGAGEGRTSLLRAPAEKIREGLAVHGAGAGARDGVEHQPPHRVEGVGRRERDEAAHQTGSTQTAQAAGGSWDWMGRETRPVGCSARRRSA